MGVRRRLVGIAVALLLGAAGISACATLLDLPPLEVLEDEAGTKPTGPGTDAGAGTSDASFTDGPAGDASCTVVTPVAEWCARCGVGCADGATCVITGQPCDADGGTACCAGTQCKNGSCQPCSGDGGTCGPCCGDLRCRSTDNKCLPCGQVGATCEALTTNFCCSHDCDIIAGQCR